MYTDLHCHLLPGVDDGVSDEKESAACLERARQEKITTLVVTPHIHPDRYPNDPGDLRARFGAWSARARRMGFSVYLGCEAYYHPGLARAFKEGDVLPLGPSGRFLLVELPMGFFPRGASRGFYDLRLEGVEPLLAHPERYVFAQEDPARLAALAESGIPFQLTTHSIAGWFGKTIQKTAFYILERGWGTVIASDAHKPKARAPMFREAVRVLAARYGKTAAYQLSMVNPRRVLEGLPLKPVQCRPRRGLFRP
ncbi:MAG: hypothetical protein P8Z49_02535 [Acidobacteriota bacterium]|jgi:protein-tyrosine phosphatase